MKIRIEDRPLTKHEKCKFHENLQEVINAYEYYTNNKFMRFDVIILESLIRVATPAQIIAIIKATSDYRNKYSSNFTYFGYIEPLVKFKFKDRRGGNKS